MRCLNMLYDVRNINNYIAYTRCIRSRQRVAEWPVFNLVVVGILPEMYSHADLAVSNLYNAL